ncbi:MULTISPECIES: hypothetical protein [unclassified Kitasatospora]|uniref:hypothetical protein n=1 Tax=unclassified Kitasatospora TaxID=2633591 RepID=UPI00381702A2
MARLEYGIASTSHPDGVEPLGRLSRAAAEAVLADSRAVWLDVYLVQRTGRNWAPTATIERERTMSGTGATELECAMSGLVGAAVHDQPGLGECSVDQVRAVLDLFEPSFDGLGQVVDVGQWARIESLLPDRTPLRSGRRGHR